jgi:hypothetical protein
MLSAVPEVVRSKDGRRLHRIADGVALRLYVRRRRRDPRYRRMDERRRVLVPHVDSVLDAILADEPIPPTPRTDSVDVDRRVAALVAALETHYRPRASSLQELERRA